jgi:hypothetical protein
MALRKPLVVGSDGLPQQLQSGDGLDASTTTSQTRSETNGEGATAIVIGAPVYSSAAGTVKRAKADAKSTSGVVGLGYDATTAASAAGYIITGGVLVATTTQWDAVAGTTGGLTFNTLYFLDPSNAGKMTSTVPTTVGQCVVLIGRALSTTELDLMLEPPILL